mgnify:CR=1 FL=1
MELQEAYETPEQVLEDMCSGYARFLEGLAEARSTGMMELFSNYLRGDGNPRLNQLVDTFAQRLGGWVKALTTLLSGLTPEEADHFAAQALEQMLFYPQPDDQRTAFSLLAFEGYAVPLVPYLTEKRRAEVAERYRKRTPPRRMMPNQKKLWKALTRH